MAIVRLQTISVSDKECECKYITGNNSALGELPYCSDFIVHCLLHIQCLKPVIYVLLSSDKEQVIILAKSDCKMLDYVVLWGLWICKWGYKHQA